MAEEERKPGPRRLLSFDASQVSLARLGKALISAAAAQSPSSTTTVQTAANYEQDTGDQSLDLHKPALAMAAAPDRKLGAIATKDSLDILQINPNSPVSMARSTKLDKKYLPTALAWGSHSLSSTIALATSGGSLTFYTVSDSHGGVTLEAKQPSNKLGLGMSLNSLSFLPTMPGNQLLGASSDGAVRLWDLRISSSKPAAIFHRSGGIAREVSFKPDSDFKFAAIYDSGQVQRWDIRSPLQADLRINAHQQGLTLDWHPHQNYLVTGGRDHHIHVWSMSVSASAIATPSYTIATSGAISKARWMPENLQVATSSIVTFGRAVPGTDRGFYTYWELSRPYIPTYCVEKHSGAITDVLPISASRVWSVGKDGLFSATDLRREPRVDANFSPVLFTWSSSDCGLFSFPKSQVNTNLGPSPSPSYGAFGSSHGNSMHQNLAWHHRRSTASLRGRPSAVHPSLHPSQTLHSAHNSTSISGSGHVGGGIRGLKSPDSISPEPRDSANNSSNSIPHSNSLGQSLDSYGEATNSANSGMGHSVTPASMHINQSHHAHHSSHNSHEYQASPSNSANSADSRDDLLAGKSQRTLERGEDYFSLPTRLDREDTPIVELNIPFEERDGRRKAADELIFDRPDNWSYADVCYHNSKIMSSVGRWRTSQVWNALGAAVEGQQQEFLTTLETSQVKQLASRWFKGEIFPDPLPSNELSAIADQTEDPDTAAARRSEWTKRRISAGEADGDDFSLPRSLASVGTSLSSSPRRPSRHAAFHQSHRPELPKDVDKYQLQDVMGRYFDFVASQREPWQFGPMLVMCAKHSLETSLELTTIALLAVFRDFPRFESQAGIDAEEVAASVIRMLRSQVSFVPAAKLLSVIKTPDRPEFELDSPDIICPHCKRPLSDNAAFLARDDANVGFWYCSHCRALLDGCAVCNETVKGLAIVILDCGHRSHKKCWNMWLEQGINECPAGCGQSL